MPIIKSDIRLIDGDVISAVKAIKEYLSHIDYEVDHEEITQNFADIGAKNRQQSVLKLYLTNSPQIVHYHLEKKSDEQIQIDIKCDLFRKFRIFYYSFLALLLIGCGFFIRLSTNHQLNSNNSMALLGSIQSYSLMILMAVLLFLSAAFFYMRSISTFPYENFIGRLYEQLDEKEFGNKKDIHTGHSFPDMWRVLFLIGLFCLVAFFLCEFDTSIFKHKFLTYIVFFAFATIGLLVVLLYIMHTRPSIKARMSFALAGFDVCIPIIFYCSPPIILALTGDIGILFEKVAEISHPEKFIQFGAIFYMMTVIILLAVAAIALVNSIQLPVRLVMQMNKFSTIHPESVYHQSFQPENKFLIFDIMLVLLWILFLSVKILGLIFAFSIFERSIFGFNYLLNFKPGILFYDNMKIVFTVLLQSKIGVTATLSLHRVAMLAYSIPMLAFLFLVLKKNFKSVAVEYSALKKQSENHEKIIRQLNDKVYEICKSAGIQKPVISVTDSPDIYAATKYIGFPIFKNILSVSKGAWNELKDVEGELQILLAHELWHIKKHTFKRKILCFLSDYSLFGNGFLALLQNSYQMEREADDFAIKWILNKYQDKEMATDLLKSLLERIEEVSWKNAIFQPGNSLNFSMFKENSRRNDFLKIFNESSWIQKAKINIKLFYQIYFGEEIQSYFHPSINQRIIWAKEEYGTNKTN